MSKYLQVVIGAAVVVTVALSAWGLMGITSEVSILVQNLDKTQAALSQHIEQSVSNLDSVIDKSGVVVDKAGKTFDEINAPCIYLKSGVAVGEDGHVCGTLADLNQTLRTMRGTLGVIEKAAIHEDGQLSKLDDQETRFANDLHRIMDSTDKDLKDLDPILLESKSTVGDLDDFIGSDAIRKAVNGISDSTVNANRILKAGADVAEAARNKYVTPKPWWEKALGYSGDGLDLIAWAARRSR